LTTPEAEELDKTAPVEVQPEPSTPVAPPALVPEAAPDDGRFDAEPVASAAQPLQTQPVYVPLAVTIGDGFKFGCGFFLALVLAMLVGFVLLAALFVLTSLFGLNLPITR
jgi:hypothetical protein